jgi:carbonyl reductase 1
LEIVRQLAKEGVTVVLTARDANRGKDALAYLKGQGLNNVNFHPLDVGSDESIKRLTEWLRMTYGGIDILINNAGIGGKGVSSENAKLVLGTNYFAVKNVTKSLVPILRNTPSGARVIVVASRTGQFKAMENKEYLKPLLDREHITEAMVDSFANKYMEEVGNGTWKERGWPDWSKWGWPSAMQTYSVSKMCVIAYVSALHNSSSFHQHHHHHDHHDHQQHQQHHDHQQHQHHHDHQQHDHQHHQHPHHLVVGQAESKQEINVFSCCPGYVATDMNNYRGNKTLEEGADTPVWLALHSPQGGSGKFWYERKVIEF